MNSVQSFLTIEELPPAVGARLLDINCASIYYKGSPVSEEKLTGEEIIDHLHTENLLGEQENVYIIETMRVPR